MVVVELSTVVVGRRSEVVIAVVGLQLVSPVLLFTFVVTIFVVVDGALRGLVVIVIG